MTFYFLFAVGCSGASDNGSGENVGGNENNFLGGYSIVSCRKALEDNEGEIIYTPETTEHNYNADNYNFYFLADGKGFSNFGSILDKEVVWNVAEDTLNITIYSDSIDIAQEYSYKKRQDEYSGRITEEGFYLMHSENGVEITYCFAKDDTINVANYIAPNYFIGEYSSLVCENVNIRFTAKLNGDHSAQLILYDQTGEATAQYNDCIYVISVSTLYDVSRYKITIYYGQIDGLGLSFFFMEDVGFIDCQKL